MRGVAAVGGGAIPAAVRGTHFGGLAHVSDWYATVAGFAGVELPQDTGSAPLDSVNLWGALSNGTWSPRAEVLHMPNHVGIAPPALCSGPGNATAAPGYKGCSPALRVGHFKLAVCWPGFDKVCTDAPLSKTPVPYGSSGGRFWDSNGTHCAGGQWQPSWANGTLTCVPHCLFDVRHDPGETTDLSRDPAFAKTLAGLQRRMAELSREGAPMPPAIQNATGKGKLLKPQQCELYNQTGFWLPVDWFAAPE